MTKVKFSGKYTSVNMRKLPAVFKLVDRHRGWHPWTINIDLGCGAYPSNVTEYLASKKIYNLPVDPKWGFSIEGHEQIMKILPVRTVTISNVLNVLKTKKARKNILRKAYSSLDIGNVYVTVYEGDKSGMGAVTKPDCWQENRKTCSYIKELGSFFKGVYRWRELLCGGKR